MKTQNIFAQLISFCMILLLALACYRLYMTVLRVNRQIIAPQIRQIEKSLESQFTPANSHQAYRGIEPTEN